MKKCFFTFFLFSIFADAKPSIINIVVIAGDEHAMGSELVHSSELKKNIEDELIPFAYSIRRHSYEEWATSYSSSTLGSPKGTHTPPFIGTELSLIRTLKLENPNQEWAILKVGQAGTSLLGDWLRVRSEKDLGRFPSSTEVPLLKILNDKTQSFTQELKSRGYSPIIRAFVWAHSPNHSNDKIYPNGYRRGLHQLIDRYRKKFGHSIPYVILDIDENLKRNGRNPASGPIMDTTKTFKRFSKEDPRTAYVSTANLPKRDGVKLSPRAQLILGQRLAITLQDLLK